MEEKAYGAESPEWAVERFTGLIGYRLLQLGMEGRFEDAESALKTIGQGASFGEQVNLLRSLGEGLERYGQTRLAAVAFTLAWTRSRGGGGWFIWWRNRVGSLGRASSIDSETALTIVAEEVEQAIASNYGPYGISQAIIIAFATGTLILRGSHSVDVAFTAWDEALAVISARTPRVAASDDPIIPTCLRLPTQDQNSWVISEKRSFWRFLAGCSIRAESESGVLFSRYGYLWSIFPTPRQRP